MTSSAISLVRAGAARLRRGALWVIFGVVLLIPKLNRLRRRRKAWNIVRIILGAAGAAMIAFGEARGHSWALLLAGGALIVLAVILQAERHEVSLDARARDLGALIVVEGGRYMGEAGKSERVKLFAGPDRLWVLDAELHVLLEIPMQQIGSVSVEPAGADWSLRVQWERATAQFVYEGRFAEHLARVADATLRSLLYRELPILR